MTTLSEWLKSEGLAKCCSGLKKEGVKNVGELTELTEEDFLAIGAKHMWGRLTSRRLVTVVSVLEDQPAGLTETRVDAIVQEAKGGYKKMRPSSWRRTVSLVTPKRNPQLKGNVPVRSQLKIDRKHLPNMTPVNGCVSLDILDEDGTPYLVIRARHKLGSDRGSFIWGTGTPPLMCG